MRNYDTAVALLNSLQTNAALLDQLRKSGNVLNKQSMAQMAHYMSRIGLLPSQFNSTQQGLNVIHVAGTKGKGSTCAFCNQILSTAVLKRTGESSWTNLKVGLFTSPHLVQVRERIRINGKPIEKEAFSDYFYQVWDKLDESRVWNLVDRDLIVEFPYKLIMYE